MRISIKLGAIPTPSWNQRTFTAYRGKKKIYSGFAYDLTTEKAINITLIGLINKAKELLQCNSI